MTYKISYQLYSTRNFPPLPDQLPILTAMGYDAIEPWLPAYEADPKLFRRQFNDAGLKCLSFRMPLIRWGDWGLRRAQRWATAPSRMLERGPS